MGFSPPQQWGPIFKPMGGRGGDVTLWGDPNSDPNPPHRAGAAPTLKQRARGCTRLWGRPRGGEEPYRAGGAGMSRIAARGDRNGKVGTGGEPYKGEGGGCGAGGGTP